MFTGTFPSLLTILIGTVGAIAFVVLSRKWIEI
jgi:hypothetical protein